MFKTRFLAAILPLALAGVASADPILHYFNNFQSGAAGPQWVTSAGVRIEERPAFTKFLGRYAQEEGINVHLPLAPAAPVGQTIQYSVKFDFYCIDSWDGDAPPGPDHFQVIANGAMFFDETFANQHEYQSYRHADVGPAHMDYNPLAKDSIYRMIEVPFTVGPNATELSIRFQGHGLQYSTDESWGIDNVGVYYSYVPTPGSAGLLGLGALTLLRRKR